MFIVPPDLDGDGSYDAHVRCNWVIESHEDKFIEFQFLYLDIRASAECALEAVVVRYLSFFFSFFSEAETD